MKKLLTVITLPMLFAFNVNAAQIEIPVNQGADNFLTELAELAIIVELEDEEDDFDIEFD